MAIMENKYNSENVEDDMIYDYFNYLVGKIFKMLPLKEKNVSTLLSYHKSLMYELMGFSTIFYTFNVDSNFISLISSLESLMLVEDKKEYRKKIFECISISKKIAWSR